MVSSAVRSTDLGTAGSSSSAREEEPMSVRKQEVVEVAKQLFAERGVKQTTVREIGANAGIFSGSLYHHFRSKDDIVDYILRDFCAEVLTQYRVISKARVDSAQRLQMMARYGFSMLEEHGPEIVIIQDDYLDLTKFPEKKDSRYQYLVDFNAEIEKRWIDVIQSGVKNRQFKPTTEPRIVYRLIRDAIIGATRWWEPSKGMSTDQIADRIVDIVLYGVIADA
jgi:AcrR family transcriptional regulator